MFALIRAPQKRSFHSRLIRCSKDWRILDIGQDSLSSAACFQLRHIWPSSPTCQENGCMRLAANDAVDLPSIQTWIPTDAFPAIHCLAMSLEPVVKVFPEHWKCSEKKSKLLTGSWNACAEDNGVPVLPLSRSVCAAGQSSHGGSLIGDHRKAFHE